MSRFELLDQPDLPFPLGGCFGYWGYDLKNFVEPKLPRRAVQDLGMTVLPSRLDFSGLRVWMVR